jgi:hypothetical protein
MDIYTLFYLDSRMRIAGMLVLPFPTADAAMAEADILCGDQFAGMEVWRTVTLVGRLLRPGYVSFTEFPKPRPK